MFALPVLLCWQLPFAEVWRLHFLPSVLCHRQPCRIGYVRIRFGFSLKLIDVAGTSIDSAHQIRIRRSIVRKSLRSQAGTTKLTCDTGWKTIRKSLCALQFW